MAKGSKAQQAIAQADKATELFTAAHQNLGDAVRLLAEAESEHRETAGIHLIAADAARETRERHTRVYQKLTELLS